MHPVLFHVFGIDIHSYGVMIALGAMMGYFYMSYHAKRDLGIASDHIVALARIIIISAVIGGKFFYYLEDPAYYFGTPANMLKNFRTGFVFYGSLIFAVPSVIWYFRKHSLPVLPMLDITAITACIIHASGRMGCFFAGCCYGLPTDGPIYVQFDDPLAKAKPLHTHLHPTQLYSVALILSIMVILLMFKRHQRFKGQLFFIYVILYAVGRSVIEIFRGDLARGFIIEDILSHSQFFSLILIAIVTWFYIRLFNKSQKGSLS